MLATATFRVIVTPFALNFDEQSFARGDPGGSPSSLSHCFDVGRTRWQRHFRAGFELPKLCARQTIGDKWRSSQSGPTRLRHTQKASQRRTSNGPWNMADLERDHF